MTTGWIHSVESLGTQDGPGIRYVVFTQGCPLRCQYCHNPDTWDMKSGKEITVDELLNKILRCKPYMKSDGGLTISGGEPTLQLDFISELLSKCKAEGIHTAIDTSGYIERDKFKQLLPNLDLVLLDIKQINDTKHQQLTGVSNKKTIELVKLLESEEQPFWVRHVIVPGITDDLEDIRRLAHFLSSLEQLEKVELLPYHKLGVHKWEKLDLKYELKDVEPPTQEKMEEIKDIFVNKGINAVIK